MSDLLKYNLGFTSAAFLFRDSVLLAKLYLSLGDWNMVRERVLSENLLQIRTIAAQKRIYSETYTRLKALSVKALEVIANGERDDQVHMIWYAKIRINTRDISEADFNVFYNNLAANHDELNHISISSRAKLTKNLFRMLVSAGIIDSDGKLCPISISKSVRQIVFEDNDIPLEIYPGI